MRRSSWFVSALTLVLAAAVAGSVSAAAIKVKPSVFNQSTLPDAAVAVAEWDEGGIDGGPGLILGKIVPTSEVVAAQAIVTKVAGREITTLGFSVRSDAYCGGGAPRFNLFTEENGDTPYFFGCNSSGPTAMTTVDTFTDSEGIEWQVKEAALTEADAAGETITSIEIVHDEQGAGLIDDIVVNNTTIGKGT